ncbi:MAG: RsmB/NOP family class I SAM-dependent RNA methyltransferase [Sulfitobacter sp.]
MTPGARVAAAIEILDAVGEGMPVEQALTRWARGSRFAGSKDRAAIRDHVFDTLRQWNLSAHLGQGETGRALMIGTLRAQDLDLDALFHGEGHAPAPLSEEEQSAPAEEPGDAAQFNLPEWLIEEFKTSLGDAALPTAQALQARAPITLRVNLAKLSRASAQDTLADEGVETAVNPLAEGALTVTGGERKIRQGQCFADGFVEFQDASSQAVVEALPQGGQALDYCAGGGGKALAMAMDRDREIFVHDIDPRRMLDIPARAERAGCHVTYVATAELAAMPKFDLVLCDAPCSGSGAWRRAPEGKWRLTEERLTELTGIQDEILAQAADLVAPGGTLAYATCSVLARENQNRVDAFLAAHAAWKCDWQQQFDVDSAGDGFFTAHLTRK